MGVKRLSSLDEASVKWGKEAPDPSAMYLHEKGRAKWIRPAVLNLLNSMYEDKNVSRDAFFKNPVLPGFIKIRPKPHVYSNQLKSSYALPSAKKFLPKHLGTLIFHLRHP